MKKTKLLKPIFASLIIESLFISSFSAIAAEACNLSTEEQLLLNELTNMNKNSSDSINLLAIRSSRINELKDKTIKQIESLKSIDTKEQKENDSIAQKKLDDKNRPIDHYSKTSIQLDTIQLVADGLNIKSSIYVQPNNEEISPVFTNENVGKATTSYWYDRSIDTFTTAIKSGQEHALSKYLKAQNFNKLNYILENTNDLDNFGKCIENQELQQTDKCDAFIPPIESKDPEKRSQYFSDLRSESDDYYQRYQVVGQKTFQANADTKSYNDMINDYYQKKEDKKSSLELPQNKNLNKIDINSKNLEVIAEKENKSTQNRFFNRAIATKNAAKTEDNVNEIARYLIKENITNKSEGNSITPHPLENPTLEESKAYEYQVKLGKLSNLELLFARPVSNLYDKNENKIAFEERLHKQINEDTKHASDYDRLCLQSMRYSRENPPKIESANNEECARLSQKFINSLDEYDKNIKESIDHLKKKLSFDDNFYAIEDLKLAIVKNSYQKCKKNSPHASLDFASEIYPCSQITGNKTMEFTNISNLGSESIKIATKVDQSVLETKDESADREKIYKSCEIVMSNKKKEFVAAEKSYINDFCNSHISEAQKNKSASDRLTRQKKAQMDRMSRNYHASMSTDGSDKVIYTPKQSFAEGFVRALVNNLATAAPGYMNYFQQGVMIDTMKNEGLLKKQALHNYKFYESNILSGQLPWYNSLSSFGYTINSNITYPFTSTTSTTLSGSGIGSSVISF